MKGFLRFGVTCLISTGALLGATKATNPWPGFAIAAGIWLLFFWRTKQRS